MTRPPAKRLTNGAVPTSPKATRTSRVGAAAAEDAAAIGDGRAVSLVLAAPTNDARASHVRPFEQALRTLRTIVPEETAPSPAAAIDAGPADASTALSGDAGIDGGAMFESAPAPTINPVGPCPS